MTYRIETTPRRRGAKRWKIVTKTFRYASLEAAQAHETYLRFKDSENEFRIKKEDGFAGPERNYFRAEDMAADAKPFVELFPNPILVATAGDISLTFTGQSRGRRSRTNAS